MGKHNQLSNDDHHQLQNQLNLHDDYNQSHSQTSTGSNHSPFKLQQSQHVKCPSGAMSSDSGDDEDSQDCKKPKASSSVISIKEESGLDNNNHHHESTSGLAIKRRKSEEDQNSDSMDIKSEMSKNDGSLPRKKNAVRSQLAQQIIQSSNKQLKKPIYPVRPAGPSSSPTMPSYYNNLVLDHKLLLKVFKYLPQDTLVSCSLVCKAWAQVRF